MPRRYTRILNQLGQHCMEEAAADRSDNSSSTRGTGTPWPTKNRRLHPAPLLVVTHRPRRRSVLYCKMCPICQMTKSSTQKVPGLLHSLPTPTRPWRSIAMDFVGPFPEANGYDYMWVVICRLTSMVHLVPIRTTTTASELASFYIREIGSATSMFLGQRQSLVFNSGTRTHFNL